MSPARSKRQPVPHRRSRADIVKAVAVGGRRSSSPPRCSSGCSGPGPPGIPATGGLMNRQPRASWLVGLALGVGRRRDLVDPARQPPDARRAPRSSLPIALGRRARRRDRRRASLWPGGLLPPRRRARSPTPPTTTTTTRPARDHDDRRDRRRERRDDTHDRRRRRPVARPARPRPAHRRRDDHPTTGARDRQRAAARPLRGGASVPARRVPAPARSTRSTPAGRCSSPRRPASGKTLVAEYAIAAALASGAKAFYTTPLKALSNQKYGDFVRLYGAGQRRPAHRRQRRSTATRRSS